MGSAALWCMAAFVGVVFGWQPLPGESERYEYIVQLDPELVATLGQGQSIPIVSDVPPEVGSIGRIRIVVGREPLPRPQLNSHRKPPAEAASGPFAKRASTPEPSTDRLPRDRIVATQFTTPPPAESANRYGNQANSAAILPPGGAAADGAGDFARSLRQGAQEAIDRGAQQLQTKIGEILPPEEQQLRGLGAAVQAEARQLFRTGDTHRPQRGDPPIGLRPSETSILRERKRPTPEAGTAPPYAATGSGLPQSAGTILPPNASNVGQVDSPARTPGQRRLNEPITPGPDGEWQNVPPEGPQNPFATAPAEGSTRIKTGIHPPGLSPPRQRGDLRTSAAPTTESAKWSPGGPGAPNGIFNQGERSAAPTGPSPGLPNYRTANTKAGDSRTGGPQFPGGGASTHPPAHWPTSPPSTPTIRKNMLGHPAGAPIQTASGGPMAAGGALAAPVLAGSPPNPQAPAHPSPPTVSSALTAEQWMAGNSLGERGASKDHREPSKTGSVFPLLLSWVLLSGSGAGNIYLFWSYFDVRGKYRNLVYESGRRREDSREDRRGEYD